MNWLAILLKTALPRGEFFLTNGAGDVFFKIEIADRQIMLRDPNGRMLASLMIGE